MGACNYYENRKYPKTVRGVRKWQLCVAWNHEKIVHLCRNKQQIGACMKIKNKTTRQKGKGVQSICDNTDQLSNNRVYRGLMYPMGTYFSLFRPFCL